jgi:hypothetical protein
MTTPKGGFNMPKWIIVGLLLTMVACTPIVNPDASKPPPSLPGIELTQFKQKIAESNGIAYFKGPYLKSRPVLESLIELHQRGVRVIALFARGAQRGKDSLVDELANRLSGTGSTVMLATEATRIPAFMQASVGAYRGDGLVAEKGIINPSDDPVANKVDMSQFETVARQVYVP